MERAASGGMLDLRLATETIRQYKPLARNFAQARSQPMLVNLHREIVFVLLKSEAAGHAAASVVKDFRFGSHRLEKLFLGIEGDNRLLGGNARVPARRDAMRAACNCASREIPPK